MSLTDLVEVVKFYALGELASNSSIVDVGDYTWIFFDQIFIVSLAVIGILVVIFLTFFVRHQRHKNELQQAAIGRGTRFRKRDKVLFYGRKMLRKVRSISAATGKKKKMISKLTKKFLQMKKDHLPDQLRVLEPPVEYLQEDNSNASDQRLPPEVAYMLHSIRMFGVVERPLFLELCKHMQTLHVSAGQFLFRIGDADENFYVVQSGRLNVFITESDGSTVSLKVVKEGDSIASLLSFTDVLTGHPQPFKTVSAQAIEESIVLKLPVQAFQEVFEMYPETFVRVIQIIMVRLHRVTFTALHQHLGLSAELVTAPRRKSVAFNASPVKRSFMGGAAGGEDSSRTPDLLDAEYGAQHPSGAMYPDGNSMQQQQRQEQSNLRKRFTPPVVVSASASAPTLRSAAGSGGSSLGREGQEQMDSGDNDLEEALATAVEVFRTNLQLDDDSLLKDAINIRDVPAGAYLCKEDSQQDCGLVYILSGLLAVSQRDGDREILMFNAYSGEFVGELGVLTGEPAVFTVRAKHYTRIAQIPTSTFYSIMSQRPKIVLHVAHIVVKRLSPFVRQIDFAMDWNFVESGRALYRQGDESDCTYIVLSGRLRSVITRNDGKKQLVAEYSRGDLVGVVETLTCTPRSTTVMAVRDTEIAKLPEGLLNVIKLKYPIVVTRLINMLGHRILGSWQQTSTVVGPSAAIDSKPSHVNFCTVAVLAVTDDVPLSAFTYELIHSLSAIGTSLRLTSDYMKKVLGSSILDPPNEYKLNSWLAQQEDKHRIVLYQCDFTMTVWTQRCIRQADCILIIGMGENEPSIGKIEKQLEHIAVRTQKELVLLHREGGERPKNTASWLNARSWCSSHHHLQCPKRMFTKRAKHSDYYSRLIRTEPNVNSDFSRLARWLTGTSVGLVLGGGGARGAAHVGMIKAIMEAGIPIDMVGGVSIGSFMGALWCSERNITTMTQKAREWSKKMTQWWRQILDLTYPATSMFSGAGFNQTINETFEDIQIEDLWLPYFVITTDISSSSMRMHTHGSLWRYVRASMSLSGYMPPLCDPADGHLLLDGGYVNNLPGNLWRYVRASMSIAGVFPPLCDPEDGHLLIDGCYVNNVPADVMRSRGARYILAVDVGSQDDTDLTNYGDSLSGWWLLWQRWTSTFRSSNVKVPSLPDIQSRLAYVSCVRQLEEVRNSDYCHYVRPPIDKYKTLQFGSFDEIKDVGYNHGKTYFDGMMKGGLPLHGGPPYVTQNPYLNQVNSKRPKVHSHERTQNAAYNFTDLAQMICKVRKTMVPVAGTDDDYSDEDTDYPEGGYCSEPGIEFIKSAVSSKRHTVSARGSARPTLLASTSFSENELDSESEYLKN